MEIATQLALFLENTARDARRRLRRTRQAANINILALTISDTVDHSVVRMIVSDTDKALSIFEEHGTLTVENKVLLCEIDNQAGQSFQGRAPSGRGAGEHRIRLSGDRPGERAGADGAARQRRREGARGYPGQIAAPDRRGNPFAGGSARRSPARIFGKIRAVPPPRTRISVVKRKRAGSRNPALHSPT